MAGSTPQRRRPPRAETRRRILDAAVGVFAQRGLDATSLDDVADAAELTKGAIYSSFHSKDDLILAVMEERVAVRMQAAEAAIAQAADTDSAAADAGARLMAAVQADEQWQQLFLAFWGRAMRDPAIHHELATRRRALRATIARAAQRAADERGVTLALPPDQVATVILALSNGLAIEEGIDPAAVPHDLFGRLLSLLGPE